ncbi:CASP10 [Branchiostoma lanceolatum]|uniref:CASP10 protein n=1 Tax=Branchiostoma lanceolatum TaxID=7740 RepID=A0A8K0A0T6_BRALA|nr:CASP10 [Branchiostoma lanceolatum]
MREPLQMVVLSLFLSQQPAKVNRLTPTRGSRYATEINRLATESNRLVTKSSLATERDPPTTKIYRLSTERDRLAYKNSCLTTEIDRLITEISLLKNERGSLATKNYHLTTKNDHLTTEKVQLITERDQLTTEKDRLTIENDRLATKNNNLTMENDRLIAEKGQATVEIERLKKVIFSNKIVYPMHNSPKGVCLIINNINFKGMDRRIEAEGDTGRLATVFGSFDFEVTTFQDLDHSNMVDVLMKQGERDHSNHDCFVCCIMSHGTTGKVFSSNDVGLDILELIKPLNATRCTSLCGKPKMFFIQACQGEKHQCAQKKDNQTDASATSTFVAKEADIFYGLATVPGYTAIRHDYGAPYVHYLATTLEKYGKTHDLLTMMAMVNENMNTSEQGRLVSSFHSTLRKKVYLCKTE